MYAQTDVSHCDVIITQGLREHSIQTSSESNLNVIFDNECTTTGDRKSSSGGLGLKAIVDEIPFDFTGSYTSSEDAMTHFCKNYSSKAASNRSSNTYEEKIITQAYDSYNQCVAFSLANVRVDYKQPSQAETTFYLAPSVTTPIQITGLKASSNVTCQGQNPITNQLITYGPATHFSSTKPFNIACTRSTTPTNSGQLYDEGSITIETNISNYDVYLPPDKRMADQYASDLQKKIDDADARISKQENQNYTIQWSSKDFQAQVLDATSRMDAPLADPSLDRIDVCELVTVYLIIKVGGETTCAVNPPADPSKDSWTLTASHNYSPNNSVGTVCHARCGKIVKSNPASPGVSASNP